jgi:hypothetical protein
MQYWPGMEKVIGEEKGRVWRILLEEEKKYHRVLEDRAMYIQVLGCGCFCLYVICCI